VYDGEVLKPPALKRSDRVRIVAPAGPFDRDLFEQGLRVLAARYQPVYDEGLFSQHRYLAGDDDRRLGELQRALEESDTQAVFCARGGYGALRLLPRVSLPAAFPPKLFVGFSDITALHGLLQSEGRVSVHGPVVTQLGRQSSESAERLFQLLESDQAPPAAITGGATWVPGTAEGVLVGGNLSVFSCLLGTPYLPPLDGALLMLEDVGERPYRLDRLWQHLALAGVFQRIRGLVLGDFTGCDEKDAPYTGFEVLRELAQQANLPCAAGFRFGHGDLNLALPLGCRARLDAAAGTLQFLEPAVSPRTAR
jgi:muramoyltetrapeptide carboxypeptidase